ncbi:MAG: hypothetical protein IJ761_03950 [Bacteroidales bacterium]|nr:hypothetical protein [Bacteroidales bacterium]
MYRRIIVVFFLLMAWLGVDAQKIHALIEAGAAFSQIEGDELKGFKQMGLNGGVGATIMLDSKERWALSTEILLSQKGAFNNTGNPYSANIWLSYVEVPIMAQFRDPVGGITFGAGLAYGRLVQQPHNAIKYPNGFIPDTTDFSFLKNDIEAVIDIRFPVWRSLLLNLRWQHSIVAVKRDWMFTEMKGAEVTTRTNNCYNHSISMRLIYQL